MLWQRCLKIVFFLRRKHLVGQIDDVSDRFLRGWVFNPSHPSRRLCVDVFEGSVFLGQAASGFRRPDLKTRGFGDGRHEFLFALDRTDTARCDLHVRVSSAPRSIFRPGKVQPERSQRKDLSRARLAAYIEPLLDGLQRAGCRERNPRSQHACLIDCKLLHDIPLSRFSIHIAHKFGYSIADRPSLQTFLNFYFEKYLPYQAPYQVPLSPEETIYWSSASESKPCRAACTFSPLPQGYSALERAYAWAVNDVARLGVQDAWIDKRLVAILQQTYMLFSKWRPFPMSRFLQLFARQNAGLCDLRLRKAADRQILYAVVLLHAFYSPHLLAFLSAAWLDRLLEPTGSGDCILTQTLTSVANRQIKLDPVIFRNLLTPTRKNYSLPAVDSVDIQIIGPFDRILGLGESCRRMARAIGACGYRTAFINFDICNASPQDESSLPLVRLARARVNVLHLNLEEIPEALAYSLAPLGNSYLIAIPYFELSTIARCHELGLEMINEIWVPTRFLQGLFREACGETHLMPLSTRFGGSMDVTLDAAASRAYVLAKVGRADPVTVFLTTGDALSWVERKNIIGTVNAFQAAFSSKETVSLLIKTHNIDRVTDDVQVLMWADIRLRSKEDPRIVLMDETIGLEDYQALLHGADCLVSLHRSEGLGLDILDAMSLGTAVVATAYSGNLDICDEATSWLVACDLIPVRVGDYPFAEPQHRWAEPHQSAAISALREAFERPEERNRRATAALKKVAEHNDLTSTSKKIGARVREILTSIQSEPASQL